VLSKELARYLDAQQREIDTAERLVEKAKRRGKAGFAGAGTGGGLSGAGVNAAFDRTSIRRRPNRLSKIAWLPADKILL
jgi:hypothetical protein